jgi:hypothetical protein
VFDRNALNAELEKIESPASPTPRTSATRSSTSCCARANNQGKNPSWTSYEKLRVVIEKKMFSNTEELLPVISFNAKASADEAKKHEDFVTRMESKGYTPKQVRLLCEWYLRVRKSSMASLRCASPSRGTPSAGGQRAGLLRGMGCGWRDAYHRHHRPPLAGKNKSVGNRERFMRRYKQQIAEAVRAPWRSATSATSSRRERHHPRKDISEPSFTMARAACATWCTRQRRPCARRPHRAAPGRRRRGAAGQRQRRGRGRLHLHPDQGRVHAALLRGPGPAAPAAHPHRRDAAVQDAPRRLQPRRHAHNLAWCAPCAAPWAGASRWASRPPRAAGAGEQLDDLLAQDDGTSEAAAELQRASRRCALAVAFLDPIDLRFRNRSACRCPAARR